MTTFSSGAHSEMIQGPEESGFRLLSCPRMELRSASASTCLGTMPKWVLPCRCTGVDGVAKWKVTLRSSTTSTSRMRSFAEYQLLATCSSKINSKVKATSSVVRGWPSLQLNPSFST